ITSAINTRRGHVKQVNVWSIQDRPGDQYSLHFSPDSTESLLRNTSLSSPTERRDSSEPVFCFRDKNSFTEMGTSVTVIRCGTYPIFTVSLQSIFPVYGVTFRSALNKVVFPAPFGPRIARFVPFSTWKVTLSRTS